MLSGKPELKQFGDLTADAFERHPVWIQSQVVDYGQPWYAETDEETFRPRDVAADPALAAGVARVRIDGFYQTSRSGVDAVR